MRFDVRIALVVIAAASFGLWLVRPAAVTPLNAALALATIWIALTPSVVYFLDRNRPPIPFIALTGLYYAGFYGISVFFFEAAHPSEIERYGLRITGINVEAQLLVLAGVALMLCAFYLFRFRLARHLPPLTLPKRYPEMRLRLLLWLLLIGYLLWRWVPDLQALPSVGQFVQAVGPLALGMFLVLWHRNALSRTEAAFIAFGALPLIVLKDLASGLLTPLVLLCAFLMAIMLYLRIRHFWLLGVVPLLLVVMLYPGVSMYRGESWGQSERSTSAGERAVSYISHAWTAWNRENMFEHLTIRPLRYRFAGYILMSHVVNMTPSQVPYWDGETYKPLPTSFIPRVLWPGKPEETYGQAFGQRYRILQPLDRSTSINIPWIVEMYANFGRTGVLLGMTLVGALLGFLSAIFNRREMSPLELVTGAAIIFPLVYPASNFSLMTGSLLPLAVCLWIYFRVGLTVGAPAAGASPATSDD